MRFFYKEYPLIDNISYYEFSENKTDKCYHGPIEAIDNLRQTLKNSDSPAKDSDVESLLLKLVRKVYNSLAKKNEEYKTLEVTSKTCSVLGVDIDCSNGILLENGNIIIFQDNSLEQKAYFQSIIKKGAL